MDREDAIKLAQVAAKDQPESYYGEPFQPHEWVITAIRKAYREGYGVGYRTGYRTGRLHTNELAKETSLPPPNLDLFNDQ